MDENTTVNTSVMNDTNDQERIPQSPDEIQKRWVTRDV